jgi:plastocyanin
MQQLRDAEERFGSFKFLMVTLAALALAVAAHAGSIEGKVNGGTGQGVVYVDTIPGKSFPAPAEHVLVDQQGLAFHPSLVVVPTGTTVDFQNNDSVQHNVFWPSVGGNKKEAHNLGTWPKGEKRPFKFTQPGVVPLLCNVHPEMSGYIVVSPTPYFAETDSTGAYKIQNVPDGQYKVVAWRQGAKPQTMPVTVSGSGKADFTLR